jgi:hypothetical protein
MLAHPWGWLANIPGRLPGARHWSSPSAHVADITCVAFLHPCLLFPPDADLTYNQISDPNFGPGSFSAGFYTVAATIWLGGLEAAVKREIAAGCRSITLAGFSLGGSVSQLLAVRIEVRRGSAVEL